MKCIPKIAAVLIAASLSVSSASAVLITYDFVPTAAPSPGGGVFAAQASFDDSLFGAGTQAAKPAAFSASLTGNKFLPDAAWELDEIITSVFKISAGGDLTFAFLLGFDNDPPSISSVLVGGDGGFSLPVNVPGNWRRTAADTASVPEGGPALVTPLVLVGLLGFAHRARRQKASMA